MPKPTQSNRNTEPYQVNNSSKRQHPVSADTLAVTPAFVTGNKTSGLLSGQKWRSIWALALGMLLSGMLLPTEVMSQSTSVPADATLAAEATLSAGGSWAQSAGMKSEDEDTEHSSSRKSTVVQPGLDNHNWPVRESDKKAWTVPPRTGTFAAADRTAPAGAAVFAVSDNNGQGMSAVATQEAPAADIINEADANALEAAQKYHDFNMSSASTGFRAGALSPDAMSAEDGEEIEPLVNVRAETVRGFSVIPFGDFFKSKLNKISAAKAPLAKDDDIEASEFKIDPRNLPSYMTTWQSKGSLRSDGLGRGSSNALVVHEKALASGKIAYISDASSTNSASIRLNFDDQVIGLEDIDAITMASMVSARKNNIPLSRLYDRQTYRSKYLSSVPENKESDKWPHYVSSVSDKNSTKAVSEHYLDEAGSLTRVHSQQNRKDVSAAKSTFPLVADTKNAASAVEAALPQNTTYGIYTNPALVTAMSVVSNDSGTDTSPLLQKLSPERRPLPLSGLGRIVVEKEPTADRTEVLDKDSPDNRFASCPLKKQWKVAVIQFGTNYEYDDMFYQTVVGLIEQGLISKNKLKVTYTAKPGEKVWPRSRVIAHYPHLFSSNTHTDPITGLTITSDENKLAIADAVALHKRDLQENAQEQEHMMQVEAALKQTDMSAAADGVKPDTGDGISLWNEENSEAYHNRVYQAMMIKNNVQLLDSKVYRLWHNMDHDESDDFYLPLKLNFVYPRNYAYYVDITDDSCFSFLADGLYATNWDIKSHVAQINELYQRSEQGEVNLILVFGLHDIGLFDNLRFDVPIVVVGHDQDLIYNNFAQKSGYFFNSASGQWYSSSPQDEALPQVLTDAANKAAIAAADDGELHEQELQLSDFRNDNVGAGTSGIEQDLDIPKPGRAGTRAGVDTEARAADGAVVKNPGTFPELERVSSSAEDISPVTALSVLNNSQTDELALSASDTSVVTPDQSAPEIMTSTAKTKPTFEKKTTESRAKTAVVGTGAVTPNLAAAGTNAVFTAKDPAGEKEKSLADLAADTKDTASGQEQGAVLTHHSDDGIWHNYLENKEQDNASRSNLAQVSNIAPKAVLATQTTFEIEAGANLEADINLRSMQKEALERQVKMMLQKPQFTIGEFSPYRNIHIQLNPIMHFDDIKNFHNMLGFKKLGVIVDNNHNFRALHSITEIKEVNHQLGVQTVVCDGELISEDPLAAKQEFSRCVLELVKADVDAVYLTRNNGSSIYELYSQLKPFINKGIPVLTRSGMAEVKAGALMGYSYGYDYNFGYYEAKVISEIMHGKPINTISQYFYPRTLLTVNAKIAREIGWFPSYKDLVRVDVTYLFVASR